VRLLVPTHKHDSLTFIIVINNNFHELSMRDKQLKNNWYDQLLRVDCEF